MENTITEYWDFQEISRNIYNRLLQRELTGRTITYDQIWKEELHPRDKQGKFTISISGDELGSYKDIKELRKKAIEYYKEHLQGKDAHRSDIGKIRFSGKGIGHTISFSAKKEKLLLLPYLRKIIETGKLGKEEVINHPRKDRIVAFVTITKEVMIQGELSNVEVLLGRDKEGHLYYDFSFDNERQQRKDESLTEVLRNNVRGVRDSSKTSDDSITDELWDVNIKITDIERKIKCVYF